MKFFGRLAEIAGEYLKKGGQVYIEGSLRTEKYTDKQGVEKYSTDIIANEMQMLGGMPGGAERGERRRRRAAAARSGGYGGDALRVRGQRGRLSAQSQRRAVPGRRHPVLTSTSAFSCV